jgi:hypothetical protein
MSIYITFLRSDRDSKTYKITNKITIIFGIPLLIFIIIVVIMQTDNPIKEKENNSNSNDYSTEQTFYYEMTATAVNENTFVTEDGNMWRMKNISIEKGKKYQLTFDNRDTEITTDDEIIDFIELNEMVD